MKYKVSEKDLIEVGKNITDKQLRTIVASYFLNGTVETNKAMINDDFDEDTVADVKESLRSPMHLAEDTSMFVYEHANLDQWIEKDLIKLAKHFVVKEKK